ncbi:MAG: hypothetical protein GY856_00395, partial [bacterium]|nr:hypothetical protein [bacterium]
MRRSAVCFAVCCALLLSAKTVAQTRSPERKPRVYALLIDWTGYFIGDAAQTRRVCEAATEHATGLLFPAGGAPSPLGFDPAFDRLFVARFGLLTNRYAIREPLRDFLQVQLGLDATGPFDAGDFRAAIGATPGLRNRDGTRGAQVGFPSIIWTLAVDRINQQAESAGLEIESVYLLILSDDKPNLADEGIRVGEKIPCLELLRDYNSGDSRRFNEFFRVYSNHLEVVERDPGIPPIRGIGEDGTGYFSAYEVTPKPASLNLADALRIEPDDYSVRSDGAYAGRVAVTPSFAGIAPAEVVSLNVELWDQGAAVFGPTPISPDLGEQELWTELPGHLGEVSGADRQYAIRAAVTIRFPAEDADGQYLSQFVTPLTYVTPVPVVRFLGLLADSEGRLIDPSRIKPGETQEQAK